MKIVKRNEVEISEILEFAIEKFEGSKEEDFDNLYKIAEEPRTFYLEDIINDLKEDSWWYKTHPEFHKIYELLREFMYYEEVDEIYIIG